MSDTHRFFAGLKDGEAEDKRQRERGRSRLILRAGSWFFVLCGAVFVPVLIGFLVNPDSVVLLGEDGPPCKAVWCKLVAFALWLLPTAPGLWLAFAPRRWYDTHIHFDEEA